jgi:hypothetical protein
MDARKAYQMTPEDLALSLARKEKKLKQALEAAANPQPALLTRAWLTVTSQQPKSSNRLPSHQVKILTWNVRETSCIMSGELTRLQASCPMFDQYELCNFQIFSDPTLLTYLKGESYFLPATA